MRHFSDFEILLDDKGLTGSRILEKAKDICDHGFSRYALYMIMNGKTKNPRLKTIKMFSEILKISVEKTADLIYDHIKLQNEKQKQASLSNV